MVSGLDGSGRADWRSQVSAARQGPRVADWVTAALKRGATPGFTPRALDIANLAERLTTLNVHVLLNGGRIVEEGLMARLERVGRKIAYDALVDIAGNGWQEKPQTVELTDAVILMKTEGYQIDLSLLLEISRVRQCCAELSKAGAEVVAAIRSGNGPVPLKDLRPVQFKGLIAETAPRLNGKPLSVVIEEWGRDGWPLYDRKPGLYPLQDILDLTS
ncbi:MAG: hypothetical protein WC645_06085 [Candidatus Margulisiibacteriota bacterium]